MDGPVFDAMLKTALMEALEEDLKDLDTVPAKRPSVRQRRRMRRMRADPWRYARILAHGEEPAGKEPAGRKRRPVRWLLVAVIAAILAGTAASYALQGGEFFRRMFEDSPWAAEYGEAANTQQLLEMGGSNLGTVVEDDQVRVELLDAVSTGESAMAAVRITILDTDLLQRTFGENSVSYGRFLLVDGSFFLTNSSQTEIRDSEMDETLADNQLLMIFRSDGNAVGENRQCTITLHDFGYYQYDSEDDREGEKVVLIPGEWTLGMNLSFDGGICYEPNETYTLRGCQIQVESVCVTALTTRMVIHCRTEDVEMLMEVFREGKICLADGTQLDFSGYFFGGLGGDEADFSCEIRYEYAMPLDREQVAGIRADEQDILLTQPVSE